MYANNRASGAPKAVFRTAGGSLYLFAHPFLSGQLFSSTITDSATLLRNEVDISSSLRLNDTFFNAMPSQDNAFQEVMVDGSTITVTNHLMAGRATLSVVPGTGLVGDGDLTAIAPFIMSSKDNTGGVLTRKRFTTRGTMTRMYYGVTFANFPHDVDAGNAVPIYTMTMLYGGWFEGILTGAQDNNKFLWAVGNASGFRAEFTPFTIAGFNIAEGSPTAHGSAEVNVSTIIDSTDPDRNYAQSDRSVPAAGIGAGIGKNPGVFEPALP